MKKLFFVSFTQFFCICLFAQNNSGLYRYPDVSATQIVFTYANDIWVVPKEGGEAIKLSSPAGVEVFPKFSPDGKSIAFTGNYDGNEDVYVMPAAGGVPLRLTSHGYPDRVVGWEPDGKRILFASSRESGSQRFNQMYTIPAAGGPAEKLPMAYAEFASYSPDGKELAVTFRTQAFRNWKRYRGGWKADIHLFHLADSTSENITALNTEAGNEFPMWHNNEIYFLTDRGPEKRMNLWRYDLTTKISEQVTHFTDYDIHFPSAGPADIVFEDGGNLYLYNFASKQTSEVKITVVSDKNLLKPQIEKVDKYIQHVAISPDGNRALIEARGDIFTLPAENGFVEDITQTSGTAERYPAWSPDGKSIAYWSDASGEYELWITPSNEYKPRKLTSYGPGFRYKLFWSPDSKKLAFIDKAMKIMIYDVEAGTTTNIDHALHYFQGELENFTCDWSADSRWLVYSHDLSNTHHAVFIYDYKNKVLHQVTSGYYNSFDPVFDSEGKYLYLLTNQSFSPDYSDIDNSFVYTNSTQVAAIALQKTTPSILLPKNDTVKIISDESKPEETKSKSKKKSDTTAKPKASPVTIDFDDIESRLELLPVSAGNYNHLSSVKGKIIYIKYPPHEENEGKPSLKIFDTDKKEEKTILDNVRGYMLSANREKILAGQNEAFAIIKPAEGQKFEKPLRIGEMQMVIHPMEEWKQILTDAWRIERDYFYDPSMHGVNWDEVKERYLKMLSGAGSRDELNYIIGEMLGELSSSHTYKGGGDLEKAKREDVGYLGVNYEPAGNFYKIKNIIKGASWDAEERSPLDMPGVTIKEGDYLLAVNGVPVTTDQEPYIAFQGLAGKTIELTYNSSPTFIGAKTAVVKAMSDEARLRYLNWIENYRQRVDEETQGQAGYIYVPSTGIDGQNELIRQFNAQWNKKALIIDERFNSGGQIPDRFIEILNRKPLSYWAMRDGPSYPWPPYANFGPKVMLINGWSGSGGDAFPDYFRKAGLGPLIGNRTWGGLIGISGVPELIDGGGITAPSFRMFNVDGTWFKEGHGVDPDIEVDEDLGQISKGTDPQLERAVTEIKNLLKDKAFKVPPTPAYEDRK
ncbi:MAG TPA: PDZ domain-containing protein [Chitinophagaceae bacterium]|nr:PDZ domain-containing protein [Chitinophagaceae bacterium]